MHINELAIEKWHWHFRLAVCTDRQTDTSTVQYSTVQYSARLESTSVSDETREFCRSLATIATSVSQPDIAQTNSIGWVGW